MAIRFRSLPTLATLLGLCVLLSSSAGAQAPAAGNKPVVPKKWTLKFLKRPFVKPAWAAKALPRRSANNPR